MMYGRNGKSISSAPVSTIAIGRFMWSIPGMFPQELLANPEVKKPIYNSGMRKGMQRGLQQGMQKGLERGMQKGLGEAVPRKRNRWPAT